jgi:hypothetical protein
MAANSGAYYEGLQYASQGVKPVNFGELSMGFAKIVEDKRLEEKRDKEKREATQMEMTRLFGEEIFSAFDGTGLADTDIVNAKIKDSIIARANVINSMYEKGELTNPQMMQEMVKLNAQSKKYAAFANSISEKVEEIQKLGGNASEYTTLMLENIDNLMKNATPVMDASGNLSFLTKDGETMVSNPFNELDRLMDVRQKYDITPFIDNLLKTRGKERVVEGGAVVEKLTDINESDEKAFRDIVNTLDDADKFDIAQRAGITVERDPNSVFKILNQEAVDQGIVDYMKETAQSKINQTKTVDEVAASQLSMQLNQDYRAAQKWAKENQGAIVNVVGDKDGDQEIQVYPAPGKQVIVKSMVIDNKQLSSVNIGKYVKDKDGNHKVTISYKGLVPDENAPLDFDNKNSMKEVIMTEDITLKDAGTINQVRTQFGMDPIKEVSTTPQAASGAGKFNK